MSALAPSPFALPVTLPALLTEDGRWLDNPVIREGLLNVGMPREAYWLFDEFLRQFVLFYMSELRMPINIEIPVINNPKYN